ncbi:two pore potassium channel protein sup-9 isoform X1 [Halyomorpha halys]|uniref:two pore potassium channel protein sup-9 isoform X1 n=2 Tax=Halyomorpha halys TaxID=286706 RepID=UPI0006D4F1CA|nr:two pore potassium channel protein sup-9-like isoform X1 [Halyomorpha halys]XP_014275574.1 two pore potassium channel protein sup-9-like isoform X1 [Halyomorpha halys]
MISTTYEIWLLVFDTTRSPTCQTDSSVLPHLEIGRMLGSELRNYQFPVGSTTTYCPGNTSQIPPKLCHKKSISSIVSSLGICVLVVGYTVLGALTFMALEGKANLQPDTKSTEHDTLRSQTVEKLWSITEDLNILYKDNWTRLAEQEVLKFQNLLVDRHKLLGNGQRNYNWSFSSAFLYSLTLITTIGYGSITPRTAWGRLITIAYALIGIPLMLVYLSTVGDTLAQHFRQFYYKLSQSKNGKTKSKLNKNESSALQSKAPLENHITKKQREMGFENPPRKRVPIFLTILIVIIYIIGGAFIFNKLENWTFIEGSYFCFTSLGTIGFGELIPGAASGTNGISVFVSSAFILIGMAIVAMCFNLIQDETVIIAKRMSLWWHKTGKLEEEEMSITVKTS